MMADCHKEGADFRYLEARPFVFCKWVTADRPRLCTLPVASRHVDDVLTGGVAIELSHADGQALERDGVAYCGENMPTCIGLKLADRR